MTQGHVVYAALEKRRQVQAFRRTGDATFVPLGAPVAAGDAVCHVAVSPDGRFLIASCWGDGRVVRMDLDAAGRPSSPVLAPAAVDPYGPDAASAPASAGDIDLVAATRALREAAGAEYAHLVPDHDSADEAASAADADADVDRRVRRGRTRPSSCRAGSWRRPTSATTSCASGETAAIGCGRCSR